MKIKLIACEILTREVCRLLADCPHRCVARYGEENADYIMETLGNPTAHYERLTYIRMGFDCDADFCKHARKQADEKDWAFDVLDGSWTLLRRLITGEWGDGILVTPPGQEIAASYDPSVICSRHRPDQCSPGPACP